MLFFSNENAPPRGVRRILFTAIGIPACTVQLRYLIPYCSANILGAVSACPRSGKASSGRFVAITGEARLGGTQPPKENYNLRVINDNFRQCQQR